ncbi:hypothetical protein R6Q57_007744 [Mikania cordata]
MQKPHVTEIKVRINCNGCVQKIKKALHGINGIDDIYIDVPQQKLTIIGLVDPEKIVKAIKKTRKLAIISSELTQPYLLTEPLPGGFEPTSDPSNQPPTETVLPCKPIEPQKEPENPSLEPTPTPTPAQEPPSTRQQLPQISRPKEREEVNVVHHYPPNHSHGRSHERAFVKHYSSSPSLVYKHESPQSIHVNHSYSTYKPTPHVTYYKHSHSPQLHTHYNRPESPQQFTHYNTPEPSQQQTHCTRPEPPLQQTHHTRPEPPQHYTHHNRPEPPPHQTHYSIPEPPQHHKHYNRPEPPLQHTRYHRPEPPLQDTQYKRPEPSQHYKHYNRPEPPLKHTHYHKPEPPLQDTQYNRPEPSQPYTNYGRAAPPPHYANYSEDYNNSINGNGNIISIFSDENPNACAIV